MGFIDSTQAGPQIGPQRAFARALEPRLMFDGAAAATAADAAADSGPSDSGPSHSGPSDGARTNGDRTDVAIVDSSVEGYEALAEAASAAGMEVIVVSGDDDGFGAVVDALQGRTDIDGLHILSHGGVGMVQIGDDVLSSNTLDGASDLLTVISGSLSEDGDLLLYGCRVGDGDAGRDFIESLAIRTGADVAASDDATGADALGGDWDLEVTIGAVATTPWDPSTTLEGATTTPWMHTLGSYVPGRTSEGTLNGSDTGYVTSGVNYNGTPMFLVKEASGSFELFSTNNKGSGSAVYIEDIGNKQTSGALFIKVNNTTLGSFDVSDIKLLGVYDNSTSTITVTGYLAGGGTVSTTTTSSVSLADEGYATLSGNGADFSAFDDVTKIKFSIDSVTNSDSSFGVGAIAIQTLMLTDLKPPSSNDPVFTIDNDGNVSETATNGTVVLADGDIQANNGDGGAADAGITYSITAGNGNKDGDGNLAFAINSSTGAVTVNDADDLDFETTPSYTLTIRANDGGGTVDTDVTITVNDVAPTITGGQTFAAKESDANSSVVGTVATTGDDDSVTFSIQSGNADGAFAINASTGAITVADTTKLDASATPNYTLGIRASDGTTNSDVNVTVTVTDDVGPTVSAVSSTTMDGSYKVGDTVTVTVQFNEAVTVTGTPTLTLETGATDRTATYASDSGTNTLSFTYTVQAGDTTADLDYTATTALALAGGAIKDAAGNNATLTLAAPGATGSLGDSKALVIDGAAPTVTGVTSTTADGAHGIGDTITVTVQFSEAVTVTGSPTLTLETGATDRTATYASGTGTDTLSFTYTVQAGDTAADLDYTATTALALAGGTIKDAAGNDATLTLAAPGAAGSLGASKALVIDGVPPGNAAGALSVDENVANGTAVGTVTAADAVSYSLTDTAGGRFAISAGGAVTVANGALLDFEANASHNITVRATDANGNTTDTVLSVTITDVYEVPTVAEESPDTGGTPHSPVTPSPPNAPPAPAPVDPPGSPPGPSIVTVIRPAAEGGGDGGNGGGQGNPGGGDNGNGGDPGDTGGMPGTPNFDIIPGATTATTGGSFPVVVIGGRDAPALLTLRPALDAQATSGDGGRVTFTLPADMFGHTDGTALIQLQATMSDGEGLPDWLSFDPATGTFVGTPPPGTSGEITVRLVARDGAGREAIAVIKINLAAPGDRAEAQGMGMGMGMGTVAEAAPPVRTSANDPGGPVPTRADFMTALRAARTEMPVRQSLALLDLTREAGNP